MQPPEFIGTSGGIILLPVYLIFQHLCRILCIHLQNVPPVPDPKLQGDGLTLAGKGVPVVGEDVIGKLFGIGGLFKMGNQGELVRTDPEHLHIRGNVGVEPLYCLHQRKVCGLRGEKTAREILPVRYSEGRQQLILRKARLKDSVVLYPYRAASS